jgi:RNA polymerase sigma-70 factor (ECF subfamily)
VVFISEAIDETAAKRRRDSQAYCERADERMSEWGRRLAKGEDAAFAELYDLCADRLFRYAAIRLGSDEAASDVVQAAFLRSVRSRTRFRDVENPSAYLFQIARNEIARALTKQARRRDGRAESLDADRILENRVSAWDEEEMVREALGRLDVDDREIVELKVFGGLTFAEIGQTLARPAATVATRYRRALASLRPWVERQLR